MQEQHKVSGINSFNCFCVECLLILLDSHALLNIHDNLLFAVLLQCAGVCGTGEQTRSVVCKQHLADHDQMKAVLPDSECDPYPRPSDHRDCDLRPCQSAEWMVSEWLGVGAWIISYESLLRRGCASGKINQEI